MRRREGRELELKWEGEPRRDDGGKRERTISMVGHEDIDDLEDEEPDRLNGSLHLDVVEDAEDEKGKKRSVRRTNLMDGSERRAREMDSRLRDLRGLSSSKRRQSREDT